MANGEWLVANGKNRRIFSHCPLTVCHQAAFFNSLLESDMRRDHIGKRRHPTEKETPMTFSRTLMAASGGIALAATVLFGQAEKLKSPAALTEQAPATYKVDFDTSKGKFVVQVHRDWAPRGADRFYNLVKNGFFD